jgi:hypothetical protein
VAKEQSKGVDRLLDSKNYKSESWQINFYEKSIRTPSSGSMGLSQGSSD